MQQKKYLHVLTVVDGIDGGAVAKVAPNIIPEMIDEMAAAEMAAKDLGLNWEEAASYALEVSGSQCCEMAAAGASNKVTEADFSLFEFHTCSIVWLLHHKGLLRKARARARKDMVVIRITPGHGIKGIHVDFEPIPRELLAANDNAVSKQRFH